MLKSKKRSQCRAWSDCDLQITKQTVKHKEPGKDQKADFTAKSIVSNIEANSAKEPASQSPMPDQEESELPEGSLSSDGERRSTKCFRLFGDIRDWKQKKRQTSEGERRNGTEKKERYVFWFWFWFVCLQFTSRGSPAAGSSVSVRMEIFKWNFDLTVRFIWPWCTWRDFWTSDCPLDSIERFVFYSWFDPWNAIERLDHHLGM